MATFPPLLSHLRRLAVLVLFMLGTGAAGAGVDSYGDPLPKGALARLGTVRLRHPDCVSGLAFAPDGKTLAASCWDGSVRLWDAATGKERRCFRVPRYPIRGRGPAAVLAVAYSPDGKTLVAGENYETTHVWDLTTGKELHHLKGGAGFGLALSPDGKTLAVGQGGDRAKRQLALWDMATGKQLRELGAARRSTHALAFSPDCKTLASGDCAPVGAGPKEDGASSVRLWDAAAGRQLRELKGHTGGVTAVAFAPDGRTLVSASHDASLRFWAAATGKQVRKVQVPDATAPEDDPNRQKGIHYGGVLTVVYSPDGRLLATGSFDGTVRLWDAGTGKELYALRGHGREVTSVVFSPDGKVLASGSCDHTIRLWDPSNGKQLQARQGQVGPVHNLTVSPDGCIAAVVCSDRTIRLWSVATRRPLHILCGHTNLVYALAFSRDGRVLASGSEDRTVRLWDVASGRELRQLPPRPGTVYSIAFTSVPNVLVSVEGIIGTLHFLDGTTGKELRQLPGIHSTYDLQLSSDGKILATADSNAAHLVDMKTGKELRRIAGSWHRIALSPDGRTLATEQATERKLRFWSVATGEELGLLANQDSSVGFFGVASYVFSPDGRLLVRVGKDDSIELWEVLTGKLRRRFHGHRAGIGPLAFSPDGKTLLAGSNDTTVLIWDVARQTEQRGRLSASALQGLWRDLAGDDAEKADQALCALATATEQSLPFLEQELRPAKIADEQRLLRRIADLDDDQFAVRDRAERELEQRGEQAETALRQALKKSPSLEARRRMERLLALLRGMVVDPDLRRSLRAVEAVEHIGTTDAQKVLKTLAHGAAEARLTREANASLERLDKRHALKP